MIQEVIPAGVDFVIGEADGFVDGGGEVEHHMVFQITTHWKVRNHRDLKYTLTCRCRRAGRTSYGLSDYHPLEGPKPPGSEIHINMSMETGR